jgi:protein-serine/threonine kinase
MNILIILDAPLPLKTIRHIFRQVVSAIQYMHENGICHRDIKDENILVDENYVAKLIDFGSCAFYTQDPANLNEYFIVYGGTVTYAAPEIIKQEEYRGPEQDIWSLGVLLYTLVYRRNPFENEDDIVDRNCTFSEDVDPDLNDLLMKIWRTLPEKRLTAGQVLIGC